jgi:cellulose synthase/poly-beta-1,6-N-acetylglucosamine synthase-like glycosyltransferase
MRFVQPGDREADIRLRASISGLAGKAPEVSAVTPLSRRQRVAFSLVAIATAAGLAGFPVPTAMVLVGIITAFYLLVVVNRLLLSVRSLAANTVNVVSAADARAVPDHALPVYTILVPAYREPEVIERLLQNLAQLDYPADRLDVKLLLEADDDQTIGAVRDLDPGRHVDVVLVPPAEPRTKPKALNYGLSMARGDLVTIYDAEDRPDPLQLRRAAVALSRSGPEVACLQATLSHSNVSQNLITRWFTLEYAMWFALFLPGLVSLDAPLPLGGTSTHFRRDVLETLGGWDPYNVTEDADLGVRFYREGFAVRVLESVTLEEANSDFVNWVKQRSRWYKGYLQTWLTHMRRPLQLRREMGLRSFVVFNLFVGGTPMLAILNPMFWTMTALWFIGHPAFVKAIFPAPIFYPAIACFSFGNFAIAYLTLINCRLMKQVQLVWAALTVPVYWVMMSIAASKALIQLMLAPNFWEKTAHGLDQLDRLRPARG